MTFDLNNDAPYRVVVNDEMQYSIWPLDRELPSGWREAGRSGPLADCLAHIDEVWTDMRPLSLRRHMDAAATMPAPEPLPDENEPPHLVERLAVEQPVEFASSVADRTRALKESVECGFVLIRFPCTEGVTDLAITLDRAASRLDGADFVAASGTVDLVGDLTLDWCRARCFASLDLATMAGRGRMVPALD